MIHPIFAAMALLAVGQSASASELITLAEMQAQNGIYFYRAQDEGVVFSKRFETKRDFSGFRPPQSKELTEHTNVAVFADPASGRIEAASAYWTDASGREHTKIDVWVDGKGHPHSLEVLKRQIDFMRLRPAGGDGPITMPFGKLHVPIAIPPIAITGILDRDTSLIPYYRGAMRLHAAYDRYVSECGKATETSCDEPTSPLLRRLRRDLKTAADALDHLHDLLAGLTTTKPASSFTVVVHYDGGGLQVPPPEEPRDYAGQTFYRGYLNSTTERSFTFKDERPSPAARITESIDPSRLDSGTIQRISEASRDSELLLENAEGVANDLFGATE